jgi:nucleoside-diphosphate-sugar epimerase
MSTGSVHGQAPARGTNERSALSIRHGFAYNTAKVRAERRLTRLRRRGTVETVVLRPTIVIGPGSRWVYDFADALQSGTAVVVDGARGICNSSCVDTLSHAAALALARPGIDREVFLVSDAETIRWCDLYRPIAEAFGIDFDRVPSISPPDPVYSFKQLNIDPLRSSPLARALSRSISADVKVRLKHFVGAFRVRAHAPAPSMSGAAAARAARVGGRIPGNVSPEVIALQRCAWKLPSDKAVRLLGYTPPITFAEGCRRSIEWLISRAAEASAS